MATGCARISGLGRFFAAVILLLGITGCDAIETWRDLRGWSKNDPDPATTPNSGNLAAAETAPYPNLATVPPPPTRGMTVAERQQLTQSLITERTGAESESAKLAPPATPRPAAPQPPPAASTATPAASTATPAASTATPAAAPAAASASAAEPGKKPALPGASHRQAAEPAEVAPMESSLTMPEVRAPPQPEAMTPAPPPPHLAAAPAPAPTAAAGAAASLPAAIAATDFQPPPPEPALPPPAVPATTGQKPATPSKTAERLGEIDFPGGTTELPAGQETPLDQAVSRYRQNPGKFRIVGHAGTPEGAVAQMTSFRAALDRAQAVAAALAKKGVPADQIHVEAAPAGIGPGENRAEILLEH